MLWVKRKDYHKHIPFKLSSSRSFSKVAQNENFVVLKVYHNRRNFNVQTCENFEIFGQNYVYFAEDIGPIIDFKGCENLFLDFDEFTFCLVLQRKVVTGKINQ